MTFLKIVIALFFISLPSYGEVSCEREAVIDLVKKHKSINISTINLSENEFQKHYQETMKTVDFSTFYSYSIVNRVCYAKRFKKFVTSGEWKTSFCKKKLSLNQEISCFEDLVKTQSIQSVTELVLMSVIVTAQLMKYKTDKNVSIIQVRTFNNILDLILRFDKSDHIYYKYKGPAGFFTTVEKFMLGWVEESAYKKIKNKLIVTVEDQVKNLRTTVDSRQPAQDKTNKLHKALDHIERKILKVKSMPNLDL